MCVACGQLGLPVYGQQLAQASLGGAFFGSNHGQNFLAQDGNEVGALGGALVGEQHLQALPRHGREFHLGLAQKILRLDRRGGRLERAAW